MSLFYTNIPASRAKTRPSSGPRSRLGFYILLISCTFALDFPVGSREVVPKRRTLRRRTKKYLVPKAYKQSNSKLPIQHVKMYLPLLHVEHSIYLVPKAYKQNNSKLPIQHEENVSSPICRTFNAIIRSNLRVCYSVVYVNVKSILFALMDRRKVRSKLLSTLCDPVLKSQQRIVQSAIKSCSHFARFSFDILTTLYCTNFISNSPV